MKNAGSASDVLGIVVGNGPLPLTIEQAARTKGQDVFAILLSDDHKSYFSSIPHVQVASHGIDGAIQAAKEARVRQLVLAGRISRSALYALMSDKEKTDAILSPDTRRGDNALGVALISWLEREHGFSVLGVTDIVQDITAPAGPLGDLTPSGNDREDLRLGVKVVQTLGRLDIGQACVIRQGMTIAVETVGGTDTMLDYAASLKVPGLDSRTGVLVKLVKPGQEHRIDLPVIGEKTIENAARAGLAGIGVEAGGVLLLDRESVIEAANDAGLFVYGLSGDDLRLE